MSTSHSDAKKRISALMRLERKIEATAVDVAQPGFITNQFGSFDDEGLTEKLLSGFRDLVDASPEEDYFSFLYAGALTRACRFPEAIDRYMQLIAGGGQYASPSAMLLPIALWYSGDRGAAQKALDAYNAPFIAKNISPRHERVEQMFAPGTAL